MTTTKHAPGLIKPPEDVNDHDGWVRFWLYGALLCPSFHWDADQREMAEDALRAAIAKAAGGEV